MVSWLHESAVWSLPLKTCSLWVRGHPNQPEAESFIHHYLHMTKTSHYSFIQKIKKNVSYLFKTSHFQKTFWTTKNGKFRALPPQHLPRWQVIEFLLCLPHHETLQHRFTLCDGARTPRAEAGTRFLGRAGKFSHCGKPNPLVVPVWSEIWILVIE